jgi:hypothetical protein
MHIFDPQEHQSALRQTTHRMRHSIAPRPPLCARLRDHRELAWRQGNCLHGFLLNVALHPGAKRRQRAFQQHCESIPQ